MASIDLMGWLRSSTTGQGAALLSGTIAAFADGKLDPHSAFIAALMGVFLILFPQNTNANAVVNNTVTAASDIEKVIEAYKMGVAHASPALQPTITGIAASFPVKGQ